MKKFIALFTTVAFIVFFLSCYSTKNMRLDTDAAIGSGKLEILKLVKKSGEVFEFSKKEPGKIDKENIIGIAIRVSRIIEIYKENLESAVRAQNGKFLIVATKDGKTYKDIVGAITDKKDKYVFAAMSETFESISIPLSEIEMIEVKTNSGKTGILILGIMLTIVASWALLPLIYAGPFGGS